MSLTLTRGHRASPCKCDAACHRVHCGHVREHVAWVTRVHNDTVDISGRREVGCSEGKGGKGTASHSWTRHTRSIIQLNFNTTVLTCLYIFTKHTTVSRQARPGAIVLTLDKFGHMTISKSPTIAAGVLNYVTKNKSSRHGAIVGG